MIKFTILLSLQKEVSPNRVLKTFSSVSENVHTNCLVALQ